MKMNFKVLLLLTSLGAVACGPGMKSDLKSSANGTSGCSNCSDGNPLSKVDLDGTVSGGSFDGLRAIAVDLVNYQVILMMPLPPSVIVYDAGGVLPGPYGGTYSMEKHDGRWALVIRLPIQYLQKNANIINPGKLPNGNPLPGVPDGELPFMTLRLNINGVESYLYVGAGAAGIFYPTHGFDPTIGLTVPIKNQSQKQILGYLSTVPQKQTFDGGFFMSLVLPGEIARLIDDIVIH